MKKRKMTEKIGRHIGVKSRGSKSVNFVAC